MVNRNGFLKIFLTNVIVCQMTIILLMPILQLMNNLNFCGDLTDFVHDVENTESFFNHSGVSYKLKMC